MTQCVLDRSGVDTRSVLHESKVPAGNEERAQRAAKVCYRSSQYLAQPRGAVLKLRKAFREGGERADFQQPIKLHRKRNRLGAVAGGHPDILGNMA